MHAQWSLTGLVCALAAALFRVPVVTSLRGSDLDRMDRLSLIRLIVRASIGMSARTIAVSERMANALRDQFPKLADRIVHIPNGVDTTLFEVPPANPIGPVHFLLLGSLVERKRPQDVVNAFAGIPRSVKALLTIAGEGPLAPDLQQQVEAAGVSDRCRFIGPVSPDRIPVLFRRHHALILASRLEGRPNVVVEAMAAGRAVIASNLPGTAELLEDGRHGYLFSPGNVSELQALLTSAARNPEALVAKGLEARERILALGLSWDGCARQHLRVYESVIKEAS